MKIIFQTIVLLVCMPFFVTGIYEAYQSYVELKTFSRTSGTVTGNSYSTTLSDGIQSGAYFPNVVFSDQTGKKITFTDGIGSLPADYDTGSSVNVIYNPQNPQRTRVYSWKRFWLAPCIFIAAGIIPAAIAFVIMRKLDL